MKQLTELGLNISEQQYRDLDEISYSYLSSLDRLGPEGAGKKIDPTESMIFGTLVDSKMDNSFNMNEYHIMRDVQVGEKLKLAVDILFEKLDVYPETLEECEEQLKIVLIQNTVDYYAKKAPEWRSAKICKDPMAVKYYSELVKGQGKTIVSGRMLQDADACCTILRTNEFTKDIFREIEGEEAVYQFKYKFKYNGIIIKGMLDRLIVDHKNKTIRPYDLKTGGKPALQFEKSFYYWRYDIQAFLYLGICNELVNNHFPGYKFDNFKFIYINRYDKKPLIWTVPFKHIVATGKGYIKDGVSYKGVDDLISDYQWYLKNNFNVHYPEQVYKDNGQIEISTNGLKFKE